MATMMLSVEEFAIQIRVDVETVHTWVEEGWLSPSQGAAWTLTEVDLARAQLILDLKQDLGVNDEGIGVILDLLDQLHGLRNILRGFGEDQGLAKLAR